MWRTLDMIELATIASSLGTLAIAISSLYQMRLTVRDSFFPILSLERVVSKSPDLYEVVVRNYGTGPALNVEMKLQVDDTLKPLCASQDGQPYTPFHIATDESKEISLTAPHGIEPSGAIVMTYECIRKRQFEQRVSLLQFFDEPNRDNDDMNIQKRRPS